MVNRSAMWVGLDPSGNGMTPSDGRRVLAAQFGTTPRPLQLPAASLSSSNMQITVAQNVWQLPDPTDAAQTFLSPMDAFTVTPAAGAASTRIDSITIKQDDPQNSGTDPYSTPLLIAGTPGSGAPTIPAGSYEAARVTVPAGASTASACTVQFMTPVGLLPLPQQATAVASLPNGSVIGQRTVVSGVEWWWNGTKWIPWESSWIAYGSTSNWTNGASGSNGSSYRWDGGDMLVRLKITVGSSSPSLPAGPLTAALPTLPTGMALSENNYQVVGTGSYQRAGVATLPLLTTLAAGSIAVGPMQVVTLNGTSQVRDSTVWPYPSPAAGDTVFGEFRLQVA